jgi:hypothetical protein
MSQDSILVKEVYSLTAYLPSILRYAYSLSKIRIGKLNAVWPFHFSNMLELLWCQDMRISTAPEGFLAIHEVQYLCKSLKETQQQKVTELWQHVRESEKSSCLG